MTAAVTEPLNCTDGEITIYASGGTAPYFYFINNNTDFQTVNTIDVTTSGVYDITVVDANNCSASTSITVDAVLPPDYNVLITDEDCIGGNGTITIDVNNANGNTLLYSIDGGLTFGNSTVFTGLDAGDYQVMVQYTTGSSVCTNIDHITISPAPELNADVALSRITAVPIR